MKNYYFFILTFLLIGQIYGQNEFYFQVLSPDSLEAIHEPNTFGITDALWGGVVTEDIVGELISLPIDDINQLLCDTTSTDFSGKFVLINRGVCEFSLKIFNAQEAGAIAAIMLNFEDDFVAMAAGTMSDEVTIPAIIIPSSMGQPLVDGLANDVPITVAFTLDGTVNTDELGREVAVKIYPNPMQSETVIELLEIDFQNGKIELYDLLGRVVREEEFFQNKFELQRQNLNAGHYFYKIILDGRFSASGKIQITD